MSTHSAEKSIEPTTQAPTATARLGLVALTLFASLHAAPAAAETSILFIGNSFTYGELTPSVMRYKTNTVTDLVGTNLGGVPALFKQMTVDRGLDYKVYLETEPGSNLDFHYNNRLALIDRSWDKVVMHGQSNLDFGAPNNPAKLSTYTGILGSVFEARNPNVDISLTATWSRADLTYQPACTSTSPWCGGSILQMGIDVEKGYDVAKADNPSFVDRINPVGRAWNNAIIAGFADPNPYDGIAAGQVNLWASDSYHASAYGYYLHALVDFGEITGLDPRVLGFDTVSQDLGFTSQQALAMQGFAAAAITAAVPEPSTWLLLAGGGAMVAWFGRRRRPVHG